MNLPVFDLHCDTALALLGPSMNDAGSLKQNNLHIDLARASKLDGYCQCFACFTTTDPLPELLGLSPTLIFERELVTIQREISKNNRRISLVYSTAQIEENLAKGKQSALLTIEGPAAFGFDPDLLEAMYQVGFRISSLGWNERNPLVGSNVTGGGLTDLGESYVRNAQQLGIAVDVSHVSDAGFWDILRITRAPILATHSNSRAVCNHPRNLTDDMFRAICEIDGTVGINLFTEFLGGNADLDTVCDHIFHFLEIDPSGQHISLGGDLDGCPTPAKGFDGIESYPVLAQRLLERGLTEKLCRDLYWNNAIRVLKATEKGL